MILGINFHAAWSFYDPLKRAAMLAEFARMGFTHARIDFEWRVFNPQKDVWDWSRLDPIVKACDDAGITPVVMVYSSPTWATNSASGNAAPVDGRTYGVALAKLAQRYPHAVIQMWNEPDQAKFWASRDPVKFAAMIRAAYPVAKQASPGTTFVLGAPTYLGLATDWFSKLYGAGIKGSYDALAVHSYLSPADLPPDAPATDWSIRGIEILRGLRAIHGDSAPLWATEFGWSTHANTGTEATYKRGVTEAQQADFTVRAFAEMEKQGVTAAFIYADRDMPGSDPHEANFGLFKADWTPKPVVAALKDAHLSRLHTTIDELMGVNDRLVGENAVLTARIERARSALS